MMTEKDYLAAAFTLKGMGELLEELRKEFKTLDPVMEQMLRGATDAVYDALDEANVKAGYVERVGGVA